MTITSLVIIFTLSIALLGFMYRSHHHEAYNTTICPGNVTSVVTGSDNPEIEIITDKNGLSTLIRRGIYTNAPITMINIVVSIQHGNMIIDEKYDTGTNSTSSMPICSTATFAMPNLSPLRLRIRYNSYNSNLWCNFHYSPRPNTSEIVKLSY